MGAFRVAPHRLLLAVALALTFVACSSTEEALLSALGGGCVLNSECEGELVCVFRRCHQACATSEDCPVDETGRPFRCVVGERPDHVCQLGDEDRCRGDDECPGNQICGVDDRCRDECAADRDCMPGQMCRAATCAEPPELDGGRLTPVDGGGEGKPCAYNSDCPPGEGDLTLFCRDGRCEVGCFEERDCPRFFTCTTADDASTPGDCVLVGARGRLFCDPDEASDDARVNCSCLDPQGPGLLDGEQVCAPDGSEFQPCVCE